MNSKFLFSIAALAMVATTNAPAHAQYERVDGNGEGMRYKFAPQVINPHARYRRVNHVAPHQVTHGNIPRSSTFLTGVNPSLLTRTPVPKPILVPETVISSGETFARVQTPSTQAFRPEFGKPAVAQRLQPPATQPNYQPRPRSAQPAMLIASKPATTRQAAPKPTTRNSASRAVRGTVLPRKQTPTPLIGAPQVANYNDTQLYAPGGVVVRSNGGTNTTVFGRVLPRSN